MKPFKKGDTVRVDTGKASVLCVINSGPHTRPAKDTAAYQFVRSAHYTVRDGNTLKLVPSRFIKPCCIVFGDVIFTNGMHMSMDGEDIITYGLENPKQIIGWGKKDLGDEACVFAKQGHHELVAKDLKTIRKLFTQKSLPLK